MVASDFIAIGAAAIAALALIPQIHGWWRGRALLAVSSDPVYSYSDDGVRDPQARIIVTATNLGGITIAVRHLEIWVYRSRLRRYLNLAPIRYQAPAIDAPTRLPAIVAPGQLVQFITLEHQLYGGARTEGRLVAVIITHGREDRWKAQVPPYDIPIVEGGKLALREPLRLN